MLTKEQMLEKLEWGKDTMIPVFLISYGRPEFLARDLLSRLTPETRQWIYIVVRESEYFAYQQIDPTMNILYIPNDYPVHNIGSTRQFVFETAKAWGLTHFWIWDDDLLNLYPMFNEYFEGIFRFMSDTIPVEDLSIRLLSKVFLESTVKHPDICITSPWSGALWRYNGFRTSVKYSVNRWWSQWQMIGYHLPALEKHDALMDLPACDEIAEDLYQVFKVMRNGGQIATIPLITAEFDYDAESTLGDYDTKKARRNSEPEVYKALLGPELENVYKINVTYDDGSCMYSGIEFKNFYKATGTRQQTVHW
jgi:hypothetical protein